MFDVFVSYSCRDLDRVKDEVQRIAGMGYNVFCDEMLNVSEGDETEISSEISLCTVFIVMVSMNSVNSKYVFSQIQRAKLLKKKIGIIILDDICIIDEITSYQHVNKNKVSEVEYEKELSKMLMDLCTTDLRTGCYPKGSYSQCGEDMLVASLFEKKGIATPSYIDIGANDPYKWSNTAYFYELGCRGINIEPNPRIFENLNNMRPEDINLNIGIGKQAGVCDLYLMDKSSHTTFSKSQAELLQRRYGRTIIDIIKVDVCTLSDVINKYNKGVFPDFLSLDAEAYDCEILKMLPSCETLPKVICVETLKYSEHYLEEKDDEIIEFLKSIGYRVYADTHMNTIFERIHNA